jgi:ribonuclease E
MPDNESSTPAKKAARKAPAKRVAAKATKARPAAAAPAADLENAPSATVSDTGSTGDSGAATTPKKVSRPRKAAPKKVAPGAAPDTTSEFGATQTASTAPAAAEHAAQPDAPAQQSDAPAKKVARKRASKAAAPVTAPATGDAEAPATAPATAEAAPALVAPSVLFQPPSESAPVVRRRRASAAATTITAGSPPAAEQLSVAGPDGESEPTAEAAPARPSRSRRSGARKAVAEPVEPDTDTDSEVDAEHTADSDSDSDGEGSGGRRRRRRGRRGRGSRTAEGSADSAHDESDDAVDDNADGDDSEEADESDHAEEVAEAALSASARRRRRRRRSGGADEAAGGESEDDPPNTVVHVRDTRAAGGRGNGGSDADSDGVRGVKGSTRLEAKRQRRRDNRDTGRRRAPILTEAEFLARREAVDRVMAVRQTGDRTQIAVLEDDILVEHYVTRASSSSAVGNVYLGRVQNVLPSMEAAFIDIGRGRNGVLYAGEVNWDAAGLEGKSRAIEHAMSSGDMVLVQVTKDPIGHKGARLTSQISLPGRFVVYVPGGGMTGISRKLPDVERSRLKAILKKVVPEDAGVIVRTAAEGASEADLVSDVERLKSQWDAISAKSGSTSQTPSLVYGEPDLAIRVVRDVFNDDFKKLVVAGADIYATLTEYVSDVAPDLAGRISLHTGESDLFGDLRVDEQLAKALDRKVYLPSGGSLVIDRTEAMVVVDVNTGKYTGSGGNLEQTVTRNNLEAAEEIVRQLRLRDIGGIVVIDFIDMVLESNRDLVLRRLTECLGRDRTKHQVAEVTSLGLVQMTRKRVGEGLLESFSEPCEHCKGRGVIVHSDPVDRRPGSPVALPPAAEEERPARGKRTRKAKAAPVVEQPDAEALAAEADKRRAAANAIAAIAAATNHHDGAPEHAEAVLTAVTQASAELRSAIASEPSEPETNPIDAPTAVAVEVDDSGQLAEAAAHPSAASITPATGGRPRRRRSASRPAGPPAATAAAGSGAAE